MPDELHELRIDLQLIVEVQRTAKIQGALHLAAAEHGARLLPQGLLLGSQVLGELELHVQVAMVDRPDFPGERTERRFERLSREACHTV